MAPLPSHDSLPGNELVDQVWKCLRDSSVRMVEHNPRLWPLLKQTLLDQPEMSRSLSRVLTRHHMEMWITATQLADVFHEIYTKDPSLLVAAVFDLIAIRERDPAATDLLVPFLNFKGFHALQTYRLAHWYWVNGQQDAAYLLQNRSSVLYTVDIHPAAQIGKGIMLDHAHGIVIGETAVVEDDVSILHGVTLGGTGKERGDRHPKIRKGVMIGAGSKILGNVEIGVGAQIASGSVVLQDVLAHTTVAGVPARQVGKPRTETPSTEMDQTIPMDYICETPDFDLTQLDRRRKS